MKKLAIALLFASLLFASGCATSPRCWEFSLVDLDLRSEEQIKADAEKHRAEVAPAAQPEAAQPKAFVPPEWLQPVLDVLGIIKGRLRVLSFGWTTHQCPTACQQTAAPVAPTPVPAPPSAHK